jgi:predicted TIM-barrel fold metal-dependent hydrolase
VTILARQIPKLGNALRRFPQATVALDHCGFPDLRDGPPFARAQALFDLASFDNLRVKVTSLVLGQVERAGGSPRDFVKYLAERFGAARLMWGSDYSQTHFRDYAGLVRLGHEAASSLQAKDREAFLGGTALEIWPELKPKTRPSD